MSIQTLCFHTEKLHDDQVWRRVQRLLALLDEKKMRVTFLVYPFRAVTAGKDITGRVKELVQQGHEVGQHTHFYKGTVTDRPHKHNDLSDANVRACIIRDYEWFIARGIEPKGFCSGAWLTTETVPEILAELGFIYDCSARSPAFRTNFEMPHCWLETPQIRIYQGGPLVLLPTSNYLTIFKYLRLERRRRKMLITDCVGYQLTYTHDDDLLMWKVWLGLLLSLKMSPETKTAQELAEFCLKKASFYVLSATQ